MPFHRGAFAAIGGFLGDVAGGVGRFAGDVFGGAREQLFPDPAFIGPPAPGGTAGGGFAERLGGFLAERAVPFLFPTRGPKALCIIGPCELNTPFPDAGLLPRSSRTAVIPTIPKSPGTLGALPIIGLPQPFDIGRQGRLSSMPIVRTNGGFRPADQPLIGGIGLPPREDVMAAALALPGGAAILRQIPSLLAGIGISELFGGGGGGAVDLPFGGRFFNQTMAGVRAKSLVRMQNPVTGSDVWFRNVGQPILFAGDFATVKRVRRIASMAHRRIGHRRGR